MNLLTSQMDQPFDKGSCILWNLSVLGLLCLWTLESLMNDECLCGRSWYLFCHDCVQRRCVQIVSHQEVGWAALSQVSEQRFVKSIWKWYLISFVWRQHSFWIRQSSTVAVYNTRQFLETRKILFRNKCLCCYWKQKHTLERNGKYTN